MQFLCNHDFWRCCLSKKRMDRQNLAVYLLIHTVLYMDCYLILFRKLNYVVSKAKIKKNKQQWYPQQKKGRYTYTRTPYTSCIPAKNGHFWSYTETYTVRSVDFSIYVYRLHTKKSHIPTHIPNNFQTQIIYHFFVFLLYAIRHKKSLLLIFGCFCEIKVNSINIVGICIPYQSHTEKIYFQIF